jgi:hypothetical protein
MIRAKLKEKFGKGEESTNATVENDELGSEDNEDTENEAITIKILNMIRNEFISRGFEGGISLTRYGVIVGQSWSVDVAKDEAQVLHTNNTLPIRLIRLTKYNTIF